MARYATPGKSKLWWVTTVSDYQAITAAEINAGVDLTSFVRNLPDLPRALQTIDIADMSSKYDKREVGTRGGDTLQVNILRDDSADTAYTTLTEDAAGFLVLARKGIAGATAAIGDEVDVYPATIGSVADGTPGRNEPDFAVVSLVATQDPNRAFSIAA